MGLGISGLTSHEDMVKEVSPSMLGTGPLSLYPSLLIDLSGPIMLSYAYPRRIYK